MDSVEQLQELLDRANEVEHADQQKAAGLYRQVLASGEFAAGRACERKRDTESYAHTDAKSFSVQVMTVKMLLK